MFNLGYLHLEPENVINDPENGYVVKAITKAASSDSHTLCIVRIKSRAPTCISVKIDARYADDISRKEIERLRMILKLQKKSNEELGVRVYLDKPKFHAWFAHGITGITGHASGIRILESNDTLCTKWKIKNESF